MQKHCLDYRRIKFRHTFTKYYTVEKHNSYATKLTSNISESRSYFNKVNYISEVSKSSKYLEAQKITTPVFILTHEVTLYTVKPEVSSSNIQHI